MKNQITGRTGEDFACQHLMRQGLNLIERNFLCRVGEIDLIMKDKDCLVFVEVRKRSSTAYGGALASITPAKQKKIIKAAQYYILQRKLNYQLPMRFDVVAIDDQAVHWIKSAFYQ